MNADAAPHASHVCWELSANGVSNGLLFSSVRQLKWTELRFWLLIVRWNMLSGFLAKTKLTFYIGFKSWLLYLSVVTLYYCPYMLVCME